MFGWLCFYSFLGFQSLVAILGYFASLFLVIVFVRLIGAVLAHFGACNYGVSQDPALFDGF